MESLFVIISQCVCIIVLTCCILVKTFTISDTIIESKTFYYRQLSKYPSTTVTIEISLSNIGNRQRLNFYLFDNKGSTIRRNCSFDHPVPVQLRNENFHVPLGRDEYKYMTCQFEDNKGSCHGKMTILDFEPRNVGFSLGISCRRVHNPLFNLKGLTYNITLSDMSNITQCLPITPHSGHDCSKFYSYTAIPNLVGYQTEQKAHEDHVETYKILKLSTQLWNCNCYQHLHEFLCYVFTPKCDPYIERMVPPCRESCWDFLNGCVRFMFSAYQKMKILIPDLYGNVTLSDTFNAINCTYLPPTNGSTPCFYKSVTCPAPPIVNNGFLLNANNTTISYPLGSVKEYVCQDGYVWTGNNTISCQHSGQWSEVPKCRYKEQNSISPLLIVVPLLIASFVIFMAILARAVLIASKPNLLHLKRNREYDAFFCYNFDEDFDFVSDSILPELEEKHDPPFKMFIHDRDFIPGRDITINICNAIENCNSTIIVISQEFVDSPRCREEFIKCLAENDRDAAFELFVILMQEVQTLINVPENMKLFFGKRTYLKNTDLKLFKRIADHLTLMRQNNVTEDNEECENLMD